MTPEEKFFAMALETGSGAACRPRGSFPPHPIECTRLARINGGEIRQQNQFTFKRRVHMYRFKKNKSMTIF
jgi:hypothetical protein